MTTVVLHISGGVLQCVQADGPVRVILCDLDNEEAGDPPAVWFPVERVSADELADAVEQADEDEPRYA